MHYGCLLKIRPAHEPRFGSVIERFFGTTHTEFIYTLLGNTQASKQPRFVTKAVDPKRQAVWTLGELYRDVCEWAYEVYDQMDHPALFQSPRQAFLQGLALFGEREQRHIEYDEAFLMATRPTIRKETALVEPGRGIRMHGIYYSHEALRHPEVEKTRVPVRFDPFNIGVASAYVQGRWVECLSQYYRVLGGHSEKEREQASQEIRRQGQVHQQQRVTVTAKRLAEFLAQAQTHQGLLLQQLRDQEARQVHQVIAGQMASGLSEEPAEAGGSQPTSAPRIPRAQARTPLDLTTLPIFEVHHE
jgi:putative transposase